MGRSTRRTFLDVRLRAVRPSVGATDPLYARCSGLATEPLRLGLRAGHRAALAGCRQSAARCETTARSLILRSRRAESPPRRCPVSSLSARRRADAGPCARRRAGPPSVHTTQSRRPAQRVGRAPATRRRATLTGHPLSGECCSLMLATPSPAAPSRPSRRATASATKRSRERRTGSLFLPARTDSVADEAAHYRFPTAQMSPRPARPRSVLPHVRGHRRRLPWAPNAPENGSSPVRRALLGIGHPPAARAPLRALDRPAPRPRLWSGRELPRRGPRRGGVPRRAGRAERGGLSGVNSQPRESNPRRSDQVAHWASKRSIAGNHPLRGARPLERGVHLQDRPPLFDTPWLAIRPSWRGWLASGRAPGSALPRARTRSGPQLPPELPGS